MASCTELGTTPNAIIGRIHRILGTYQKIAKQLAATQEVARRRRKLREKRQHAIIRTMLRRIDAGLPRDKAVERARAEGGTLQSIGAAIGLSREGVRQIGKRTRA
jgi:DNA-directed RNA polymerase sigma subunit (sigma70/sigma32)